MRWLRQHAPRGIPESVKPTGGVARWARELRMPPPPHTRWTDDLIEQELRRLTDRHDHLAHPRRRSTPPAPAVCEEPSMRGRGSDYWADRRRPCHDASGPRPSALTGTRGAYPGGSAWRPDAWSGLATCCRRGVRDAKRRRSGPAGRESAAASHSRRHGAATISIGVGPNNGVSCSASRSSAAGSVSGTPSGPASVAGAGLS